MACRQRARLSPGWHTCRLGTVGSALTEHGADATTARHLNGALSATEGLLAGSRDIARLDIAGLHPQLPASSLAEVLDQHAAEFRAFALDRDVKLDVVGTRAWVRSDPQLLRRALQNFLSKKFICPLTLLCG